jgi:formate dehydrogenase iron-sulfur subunit
VVADIFRQRSLTRGKGGELWGWGTAYGGHGEMKQERQREQSGKPQEKKGDK